VARRPGRARDVVWPRARLGCAVGAALVAVAAFGCTGSEGSGAGGPRPDRTPNQALAPGEPYPYDRPAPPRAPTPIDGTYVRRITIEQAGGRPVYCRRCAPYRRDAGRSTITFDEGRLFVRFRPVAPGPLCSECLRPPDFSATAHYRVSGDRLTIFNDANCTHTPGVYRWSLDGGRMRLEELDDPCPYVRLRAKFLTVTSWRST
jgi:hypothetical protein